MRLIKDSALRNVPHWRRHSGWPSSCLRRYGALGCLAASLSFLVSATAAPETGSGDWARLLGPLGNGASPETGLADRWPAQGPPVLWQRTVGSGYSAPAVLGGRLVLHQRIKNEEIVESFDAASGQPQWRYAYPSEFIDPYGYNNGPRSSPVLTPERCYTFGAEGKLLCLDLKTGQRLWERDTAKDWEVPPAFFGVGSTPLLEGGLLLVMVGGQPNSGMVAFDPSTGKTVWENVGEASWQGARMVGWPEESTVRWQRSEKQASYSTPLAVSIHGQRHLLCLMRQGLVSLDPQNGKVRFRFWFRSRVNDSVNAMTPIVVDDCILLSAAYYHVGSVLLKVHPDSKGVDEVWRSTSLEMHWANPLYYAGFLYGFSGRNEPDARFRCVEFKTGKVMWERDEHWAPHSTPTPDVYGRGAGILADGKLIVLGEGGLLGLFKPAPEAPQELSRIQLPSLHHPCWAAPILVNKRLYLRSEDRLLCLDMAAK